MTQTEQHTPGPWDCTGCMFPDDDMGGVYYRVQAEGMDARAANARLIAAAPELLEALRNFLSGADAGQVSLETDRAARAAIARATGASS